MARALALMTGVLRRRQGSTAWQQSLFISRMSRGHPIGLNDTMVGGLRLTQVPSGRRSSFRALPAIRHGMHCATLDVHVDRRFGHDFLFAYCKLLLCNFLHMVISNSIVVR